MVQPAVHSTDAHGTDEVNFALLHVFGYQFAPRYRNIQEKVRTGLYGFEHPRHYADLAHQAAAGEAAGIAELGQISPVAWQHINLYGRYEFTRTPAPMSLSLDSPMLMVVERSQCLR